MFIPIPKRIRSTDGGRHSQVPSVPPRTRIDASSRSLFKTAFVNFVIFVRSRSPAAVQVTVDAGSSAA